MKRIIIFGILFIIICGSAEAQLSRFKADTIRAIDAIRIKTMDRTTFFDKLSTVNQATTDAYGDSTVTLQKLTTAAYNFVGSGGNVTNNPDDVTIENKGGSTLGIKGAYIVDSLTVADTLELNAMAGPAGRVMFLGSLNGTTNPYGGGIFFNNDSTEILARFGSAVPDGGSIFPHPTDDRVWVRDDLLKGFINPTSYGAFPDSTNDAATTVAIQKAVDQAFAYGKLDVRIPRGVFFINDQIVLASGSNIRGSGEATTKIHLVHPAAGDRAHFLHTAENYTGNDSTNLDHYLGYMTLTSNVDIITGRMDGGTFSNITWPDDGGIYIAANNTIWNKVTVEHITLKQSGLGIQIKVGREAHISECSVINSSWVAYTPIANKIILSNCYADSVAAFAEAGATGYPKSDSLASVIMKGNIGHGIYDYGMKVHAYGDVLIEGNILRGQGINFGDNQGIYVYTTQDRTTDTYYSISKKRGIEGKVHNNIVTGFFNGIQIISWSASDTLFHAVDVTDNTVWNMFNTGIEFVAAANDSLVGKGIVSGNKVYNVNRGGSIFAGHFKFSGINRFVLENNIAWSDSLHAGDKGAPVVMGNTEGMIIRNNDFRSPAGLVQVYESATSSGTVLYNNLGMHYQTALNHDGTGYWQNSLIDSVGTWQSQPLDTRVAVLKTFILDTLCTVGYDNSGAPVDTVRQHPQRP